MSSSLLDVRWREFDNLVITYAAGLSHYPTKKKWIDLGSATKTKTKGLNTSENNNESRVLTV